MTFVEPLDYAAPTMDSDGSLSSLSSSSSPLSPRAIFRDNQVGGTTTSTSHSSEDADIALPLMKRANPIDSMDEDCSGGDGTTAIIHDCSRSASCQAGPSPQQQHDDDMVWIHAQQRVISPFPGGEEPLDDEVAQVDSWNEPGGDGHMDFSLFFPSANVEIMECDDFSLSSASGEDDLVLLADDLTNPESFWESGSHLSRSPSPALVSLASQSSALHTATAIFPPSPTSTTEVPYVDTSKLEEPSTPGYA